MSTGSLSADVKDVTRGWGQDASHWAQCSPLHVNTDSVERLSLTLKEKHPPFSRVLVKRPVLFAVIVCARVCVCVCADSHGPALTVPGYYIVPLTRAQQETPSVSNRPWSCARSLPPCFIPTSSGIAWGYGCGLIMELSLGVGLRGQS